jgi:hypothetical protein
MKRREFITLLIGAMSVDFGAIGKNTPGVLLFSAGPWQR